MADWCKSCAADSVLNGTKSQDDCGDDERCFIVADTMTFNIDDPEYPTEWIIDEHGSRCTAHKPLTGDIFRKCRKPAGVLFVGEFTQLRKIAYYMLGKKQ